MIVGVSGAGGRMGRLVAETIARSGSLTLGGLYDPQCEGIEVAGVAISADPAVMGGAEAVVEFTHPAVVMENLATWRSMGLHAVVGTSGFDAGRLDQVRALWGGGPPNCLIVPNFSIGAVLMMRFAEAAAPHFSAAEVIELHHDRKADAPSGTAVNTAERIGRSMTQRRAVNSTESHPGARGATVEGVSVHSVRLPGLLAHQEVLFGNDGEVLSIRHDSTDRSSFMPGVLLALGRIGQLPGVSVGIDQLI